MSNNPAPGGLRWLAPTAVVLAGLWAAGITVAGQALGWLVAQFLIIFEYPVPDWYWPVLSVATAVIAGTPAAIITLVLRSGRAVRPGRPALAAVTLAWLLAAGIAAFLSLARAVPTGLGDALNLLALALIAGIAALVLRRGRANAPGPGPRAGTGVFGALATGLVLALPWWWVGALGSASDTVAAVLAALAVGAVCGQLWAGSLGRVPHGLPGPWGALLDLLALLVALVLVAGSTGGPGVALALLCTVPAAALAVVASDRSRALPAMLIVAGAVLGPLALIDPEEVLLLLVPGDIPRWTAAGTASAVPLSIVAGLVLVLAARLRAGSRRTRIVLGVAATTLVLAATVVVALVPGQPGFHGDRLFVVLRGQADLSQVGTASGSGPAGVVTRRKAVYRLLVAQARRTQRPLRKAVDSVGGHSTPYYLINAIEVDDSPAVRAALARRRDVASVRPSPRLRPLPAADAPVTGSAPAPTSPGPNLTAIKAPQAWAQGVTGSGVVVGTSDTGVDGHHPALRDSFRGGTDSWYDPWNGTKAPADGGGHGTHTTATAVGRGVGVAPGARWIGCVNLGRNMGNPARYLDCLQFLLAPFRYGGDPLTDGDPARAADVLNNSWGCSHEEGCAPNTLRPAVTALRAAGIFVVVSAGNAGDRCDSIKDPLALYDDVFTVGATDDNGVIADFSSRGPVTADGSGRAKPDVVAPGVDVLSALPGGKYGRESGTSMAGPHVAGLVALVWQADPALRGDIDGTERLLRTATTRPSGAFSCGGARNVVGSGLVDANAAVTAAHKLAGR